MAAWSSPVELRVEARDAHSWLAIVALGGLVLGGAMAIFGLLAFNQQRNVELLRTAEGFSPVDPLLNALPILGACVVLFIHQRRLARRSSTR